MADIDYFEIPETAFDSDPTGGKQKVASCNLRLAGEQDGTDEKKAEMWGHYGLAYRPALPVGDDRCQAMAVVVSGKRVVTATRDLRGADCHGALNAGDVALWSVGKNTLRLNADGSCSLLKQGDTADSGISIEKDGSIRIFSPFGMMTLDENGWSFFTASGQAMVLNKEAFQVLAPQAFLQAGVVGLGPAPSKPLCTGAGPAAVPIPYILG